jgi:hypothetical protein
MRNDTPGRKAPTALGATLLAAALLAGCGDEPAPMDAGIDAGDTDTDTGSESDTTFTCTAEEIDAQNAAILAALAEGAPCFSGQVIPWPDEVNVIFTIWPDDGSLVLCADSLTNATAEELQEEAARLAVAGLELPCIGNCTYVNGGSAEDAAALRAAIDALTEAGDPGPDAGPDAGSADGGPAGGACAVEGLADPLFRVDVDDEGAVANVAANAEDTSPETAAYVACLDAELAGMALPCLAAMQICSSYP